MKISVLSCQPELINTGHDTIRLFYPEAELTNEETDEAEIKIVVSVFREEKSWVGQAKIFSKGRDMIQGEADFQVEPSDDLPNQQKRLAKLAIYRALTRFTERRPGPWGVLTGVRPTKIVHRLIDDLCDEQFILRYLSEHYDMTLEKAALLSRVAFKQRPFLLNRQQADELVSLYIGIPFCPTRCAYCSFPAYAVGKSQKLIEPFLSALKKEIMDIGQFLRDCGKKVQTLYIGGGTPTVLEAGQLEGLLDWANRSFVTGETLEITLEAGRPDTITREKLNAAKRAGVTRLSINPQTMNRDTLNRIGRCHSPEDIVHSMALSREAGFSRINMDLILGLPGETPEDVAYTLGRVLEFRPENLTVHTLAVKRASHIKEARENFELPTASQVSGMLDIANKETARQGLEPYYLYRQKNMLGGFENIGYASEGCECLFNIQMMEERQTIIGLGGGAASKFLEPGAWYLKSHYNPKDPENYINRVAEMIARKKELITSGISVG